MLDSESELMETGCRGDKAARWIDSSCKPERSRRPLIRHFVRRFRRMRDHMVELLVCCANADESSDELSDIEKTSSPLPPLEEKLKQIPAACPGCTMERFVSNEPPAAPRHSTSTIRSPFSAIVQDLTDRGSMLDVAGLYERTQDGEGGKEDEETEYGPSLESRVDEVLATPRLLRVEQSFADMVLETLTEDRGGWTPTNPAEHDKVCAGFKQLRLSLKRVLAIKKLVDECEDDDARVIQRAWMNCQQRRDTENACPSVVPMGEKCRC